jgi:hypothetical protein
MARRVDGRTLAVSLATAVGLLILGGEGHFFYANTDWMIRDAVLGDLSRSAGLPHYALLGHDYVLRAPLGMYETPALVGRRLGVAAAPIALIVQNALVLGAVIYFAAILASGRRLWVVVLMFAFSGLDLLGLFVIRLSHFEVLTPASVPSHIVGWSPYWQYSNQIAQLFWVPNQALPGWWLALLVLLCAAGEASLGLLGLTVALATFWSPLAAAGTLPFAAALFLRRWRSQLASSYVTACAATSALFLPVVVYLTVDWRSVPHEWLWLRPDFAFNYLLFLALELPQLAILAMVWRNEPRERRLLVAVLAVVLIAIPLGKFGAANDFAMRASIPALWLLAFMFSDALANRMALRPKLLVNALAVVLVGAVTPALEIARSLIFPPYAISPCNLGSAAAQFRSADDIPTNYVAQSREMPPWLLSARQATPALRLASGQCWPDYPFVGSLDVGQSIARYSDTEMLRDRRRAKP